MSHVMISETRCWKGVYGTPDMLVNRYVTERHGWASPEAAAKHWRNTPNREEVSPGIFRTNSQGSDTYQLVWFEPPSLLPERKER